MKKNARAHTNIALIKYWGKADKKLKTPLMSSLSMTLDAFYTDTSFEHGSHLEKDTFTLNGIKQDNQKSKRVIDYIHTLQRIYGFSDHFEINSTNHVPTSAGLASSASAFAALATAFAASYNLNLSRTELSKLARLGSGSATRSIYGGFVLWQKGKHHDNSYALPIDEDPNWDLHMLAIEVNTHEKKISSSQGMIQAQTSPFYKTWLNNNATEIAAMKEAIENKNFTQLGQLSENSANEMHALNLSAQPGFTYFEADTLKLITLVQELRHQGIECYYTIDAGPNVKILCTLRNRKKIISYVHNLLGNVKIIDASFGPGVQVLD
ncbi:diphosphomevalonate decarboxylase [Lactobacillus colini]|uniref:diphosphomevalonate decarboxylase n=1 Tax=Lactobacillus colini TaxID=1819254 RepID=A0ABS4MCL8_9LACO|nr:diphosphomevalonate decarboxylase [Lactobacillus colini]MBP2057076.1 diphosphomevalonate decarboxylase [Lactobacillus colini]